MINNMTQKDILKLVEDAFNQEIFASCAETFLGLEAQIEGKDDFLKNVAERLKLLFEENDLTK